MIDFFGTSKQVAVAPSIHPDTENRYRWEVPLDPKTIPAVDADIITPLVFREGDSEASDEALNMTKADVLEMVMALPMWQVRERQAWIEVGMSIKHQLGDEGLDVFREFSKRDMDAYKRRDRETGKSGPLVCRQQYESIKNNHGRGKLRTMRSVIADVHDYEIEKSMAAVADEFDDLDPDVSDEFTGPRPPCPQARSCGSSTTTTTTTTTTA